MGKKSPKGEARSSDAHAGEGAHARTAPQVAKLQKALLRWYSAEKRDLPWRRTRDPYAVWLSEVMLQQTRVDTVIPYYERFLAKFPTVFELAEAPLDDVLTLWAGLGYYRRARMLHKAAGEIRARGSFPATAAELLTVSGIGPYTAGAVASIAYRESTPLVDGNVHRVLSRIFAVDEPAPSARKTCWNIATAIVPREEPGEFNQALMELGAMICTPTSPRCDKCPVAPMCAAKADGLVDTLPRAPKKKTPPIEKRSALLLRSRAGGAVLFARRIQEARFGGLWEPPIVLGSFDAVQLGALGMRRVGGSKLELAGAVRHVLTHRILEIDVYRALSAAGKREAVAVARSLPEYDAFVWAEPSKPPGGVSTMARKVLEWL